MHNHEVKDSLFLRRCWAVSLSCVRLFVTPWTANLQAPLAMGILQSRILEWVARPSSRGSSQPRDRTQVSIKHAKEEACLCVPCTAGRLLPFAPSGKYNSNLQIHYNPYQNHNGRFCKNVKAYPKIRRNCKELWIIKIILKQMSKFGGFTFSDFKAY